MLCQLNGRWETGALVRPFGRGINFQTTIEPLDPVLAALTEAGWPIFEGPDEAWYGSVTPSTGSGNVSCRIRTAISSASPRAWVSAVPEGPEGPYVGCRSQRPSRHPFIRFGEQAQLEHVLTAARHEA